MKRTSVLAAFLAALFLSCLLPASAQYNTYATPPMALASPTASNNPLPALPLIRGIPPLWVTVQEGTGTATRYLERVPLVWDPSSHELYASGSPLIVRVGIASVSLTASGEIDVRISSSSVTVPTVENENDGYLDDAGATAGSYTVSLPAGIITDVGAKVPAAAHGIKFYVFGSDVLTGDDGILSTGPIFVGSKISSGSFELWNGKKNGSFNYFATPTGTDDATGTFVPW